MEAYEDQEEFLWTDEMEESQWRMEIEPFATGFLPSRLSRGIPLDPHKLPCILNPQCILLGNGLAADIGNTIHQVSGVELSVSSFYCPLDSRLTYQISQPVHQLSSESASEF